VAEAFDRLRAAGTEQDAAKRAIAEVLGEWTDRMLEEREPFDEDGYKKALAGMGSE
jgi:hypothetical protein